MYFSHRYNQMAFCSVYYLTVLTCASMWMTYCTFSCCCYASVCRKHVQRLCMVVTAVEVLPLKSDSFSISSPRSPVTVRDCLTFRFVSLIERGEKRKRQEGGKKWSGGGGEEEGERGGNVGEQEE